MFGFSLQKLIFTAAVIALIWYGFKWLGRVQVKREREAKERLRGGGTAAGAVDDAETMIKCPACGAYVAASAPRSCGQADCPYPG
ncbi:MAG TPA: hypothetical protein VGA19_04130 [Rhodospirillales bacterium]|jgi:uncharacterized protein